MLILHCFDYCHFVISFEMEVYGAFRFVLLFWLFEAPCKFYMNLIGFFISANKTVGNFFFFFFCHAYGMRKFLGQDGNHAIAATQGTAVSEILMGIALNV